MTHIDFYYKYFFIIKNYKDKLKIKIITHIQAIDMGLDFIII